MTHLASAFDLRTACHAAVVNQGAIVIHLLNAALAAEPGTFMLDLMSRPGLLAEVMAWAQENELRVEEQVVDGQPRSCRVYAASNRYWPVVVVHIGPQHAVTQEAA